MSRSTAATLSDLPAMMPDLDHLDAASARAILKLRLGKASRDRCVLLSTKANRGRLTDAERDELEMLLSFGDMLSILQARARLATRRAAPSRLRRKTA